MAVAFQVAMGTAGPTDAFRVVALLASYGIMGVWLLLMLREGPPWWRGGFGCVAVGYALNLAAIVPNGSMPVSLDALRRVGASPQALQDGPNLQKHVLAGDGTVWAWLGDVVPVGALGAVISAGDIAMLIGVAIIAYAGMTSVIPPTPTAPLRVPG
jgi:hypothetical protein